VSPMLSLVMDPREAVPLSLPFLIFADWFALKAYWREWDTEEVRLLLPSAVVGVILGALALSHISPSLLRVVIGILTLLFIIYRLVAVRFLKVKYEARLWHGYLAGFASGFASTLANAGAFPFMIYMLLRRKMEAVVFIGTVTLLFTLVNLLKVPMYIHQNLFSLERILSVIWALPLIIVGVWVGRKSVNHINQQTFERLMMALLVMAVILLFASL
jgi:uncharacterized membrane protein YfcA